MSWIRCVDVSMCQGVVDWQKVAASGVRIAIIKATEATWTDPKARENIAAVRDVGSARLRWGVYCYGHVSAAPEPQADWLWEAIGDTMPDLPPALDLENGPDNATPHDYVAWAEAWITRVASKFGRSPMLYTYPWFWKAKVLPAAASSTIIGSCPLWMADESGSESPPDGWHPYVPQPWTSWALAQTSGNNSSRVPGILGAVDHSVLNGGDAELDALCGLAA